MLKLLAGIFGKSMAMLSDAIHSLSDVFGSIIVIIGVKVSKKKEDADHPFGHDRLECLASLALGAILFFTGAMLAYEGINKIYTKAPISTPGKIALFAAIVSIIAKEGMFWYTKINANRINSDALRAEAWHHRSDALSSVGSLIGVAGAMLGLKILDPIMGCVIGLVIIKVAFDIAKEAIDKIGWGIKILKSAKTKIKRYTSNGIDENNFLLTVLGVNFWLLLGTLPTNA